MSFLSDITIYIPSTHRHDKIKLFGVLPPEIVARCVVVCPQAELPAYCASSAITGDCSIIGEPAGVQYIGAVRQWCLNVCPTPYAVMLDDDLVFSKRIDGKLKRMETADMLPMFHDIYTAWKSGIALVGISARQGNNFIADDYKDVDRMVVPLCINVAVFQSLNMQVAPYPKFVMDDYHIILTMLEAGYKNRVFYKYAHEDRGSNSAGGCSTYRNAEEQRRSAITLMQMHPRSVKVVAKKSNTWKGMQTLANGDSNRVDVNIRWQNAYIAPKVITHKTSFI